MHLEWYNSAILSIENPYISKIKDSMLLCSNIRFLTIALLSTVIVMEDFKNCMNGCCSIKKQKIYKVFATIFEKLDFWILRF